MRVNDLKNKVMQSFEKLSNFLKIIIIISILLGIFFRFSNLDNKVYSNDETFSTTYIFGQNLAEVIDGRIVTAEELQSYQRLQPNESLTESVQRIIKKPFVFPPLYAILMQLWARFISSYIDSPAVITRSLSALISIFSLICTYWLCWELFGSKALAWMATALIAVSPFHLQYSQIVRTYSLTTVSTLLSSAALLRAIRVKTKQSWFVYGVSLTVALYSNLLLGFLAIAQAVYVFTIEKFRFNKTVKYYIFSAIAGGCAFLPWFILFVTKPGLLGYSTAQVLKQTSSVLLLKDWITDIIPIFVDFNNPWIEFTMRFKIFQQLLSPFIVLLVIISIFYILFKSPQHIRLFIFLIILFCGFSLMLKDLIMGGTFSTRLRYMLPYVLAIEIAVIYCVFNEIQSNSLIIKKIGEAVFLGLIVCGIISCSIILSAESWWVFGAPETPVVSREINKAVRPVVLFEDFGDALTMSYLLDPNVHCHLTRRIDFHLIKNKGVIYKKFGNIFLYNPTKNIHIQLEKKYGSKMKLLLKSYTNLPKIPNIWRIEQ